MFEIRVFLDEQMFAALLADASRHLRPTAYHAKALLREALRLPFPYPEGFDERDPTTWAGHSPTAAEVHRPIKNPASGANAAGRGASTEREMVNDDARG